MIAIISVRASKARLMSTMVGSTDRARTGLSQSAVEA